MTDPVFLETRDILEIHQALIDRFGGEPGLRDRGLLQSALAMPQAGFGDQYFHKDLHEMAAAYLYHLIQNHPFMDGNKRIGATAAMVFLKINGLTLSASEDAYAELALDVAQGRLEKPSIAAFFRRHARKPRR